MNEAEQQAYGMKCDVPATVRTVFAFSPRQRKMMFLWLESTL